MHPNKPLKLIILDRDGVINHDSPDYIKSPEEWLPIENSLLAIKTLNRKGFTVTVATNQSGLARKYYSEQTLTAIHKKMHDLLSDIDAKVDSIFYCPHGPNDNCRCRKPNVGLLEQIRAHYQHDLRNVPFIGDSKRDLEAAIEFNCTPILVKTGNGEKTLINNSIYCKNIQVYPDLYSFSLAV